MGQPIPNLAALDVYRPGNPQDGAYYPYVQNHFEQRDQVWDERYAPRFGFWRPHVMDVIHRYLDCGDLHQLMHIPDKYAQTVRYYGFYSNKSRGLRNKRDEGDEIPAIIPNEMSSKEFRRNWARLIQKIYEVDPLL